MARTTKNFHTFEQWHHDDIQDKLNIIPANAERSECFRNWIHVTPQIPEAWADWIENRRQDLYSKHESWNETELLGHFILPFMITVQWNDRRFNLFNERPLHAKVKGYDVRGMVDGIVAKGSYEPEKPYFFLHEYKRMQRGPADPLGQLLIAMLAARELNQDNQPLYGCYIIGAYWRFVLLEDDFYVQTQGYDASDKGEIAIVWAILNQTKKYIEIRVAEDLEEEKKRQGVKLKK